MAERTHAMGVAERITKAGLFDVDAYMAFLEGRPDEEKWQLVDGVATLMNPPTFVHQRLVWNLQFALNPSLASRRLFAYGASGVRLPSRRDFQPEPDVVVAAHPPPEGSWTNDYALVAEILSPSNSREMIDRKVELYKAGPACLHVLVIAQDVMKVVHRARASDWTPSELFEEDRLVLPEFGVDVGIPDLYAGLVGGN